MIYIQSYFENFLCHIFAYLNKPTNPASIYNEKYIRRYKNNWIISKELYSYLEENIAILTHYSFYSEKQEFDNLSMDISNFFSDCKDSQKLINAYQIFSDELTEFIKKENLEYKKIWDSIHRIDYKECFINVYEDHIIKALEFFQNITGIKISQNFEIHLVYAIPGNRGKSINYNNKIGIAISLSKELVERFNLNYLEIIIHEMAHVFTDALLNLMGFSLGPENIGADNDRREASANFLSSSFLKYLLLPIQDTYDLHYVPDRLKELMLAKMKPYHLEIRAISFNQANQYKQSLNSNKLKLIEDLFFICKKKKSYLFFAALLGRVVQVPDEFIESLSPFKIKKVYSNHFKYAGLLVPMDFKLKVQKSLHISPNSPDTNRIRFHMTNDCNLMCKYCYLSGGENKEYISRSTITNTIDAFAPFGKEALYIEFHGGGEPTLAFDLIKEIWSEIQRRVKHPQYLIQSNGVFDDEVKTWLVKHGIHTSISIDGPYEIQRDQRTVKDQSFKIIIKNIKDMLNDGAKINTISVITKHTVDKMAEIYFFLKKLGVKKMMFNPLHELGRATNNKEETAIGVDPMEFTKKFLEIKKIADQDNIYLISDFFPDFNQYLPKASHCDACRPGCNIHMNGDLTACTRAYNVTDLQANPFVWGNIASNGLNINKDKQSILENRIVESMPECNDCFLKWSCAGDCLIELYLKTNSFMQADKQRCNAMRYYAAEYFSNLF